MVIKNRVKDPNHKWFLAKKIKRFLMNCEKKLREHFDVNEANEILCS